VGYCYPDDVSKARAASRYFRSDNGKPVLSIVCMFAANIDGGTVKGYPPVLSFPIALIKTIESGVIKKLHAQGQIVLLTVLGNHLPAGWSTLTDEVVGIFADQLVDAVNYYQFDGVDIDDEYTCSKTPTAPNSMTGICRALRANPKFQNRFITKALFQDIDSFPALAPYLDFGWEMSYGSTPYDGRLQPYIDRGMAKEKLFLGISATPPDAPSSQPPAEFVTKGGYGGIMVFDVQPVGDPFVGYLTDLVRTEYGPNVSCVVGPS